jgi:hypothetical protein
MKSSTNRDRKSRDFIFVSFLQVLLVVEDLDILFVSLLDETLPCSVYVLFFDVECYFLYIVFRLICHDFALFPRICILFFVLMKTVWFFACVSFDIVVSGESERQK